MQGRFREVKVDRNAISILVAGSGFGEGILVKVGRELLVGIDCCSHLTEPSKTEGVSPLEREVADLCPSGKIFWILTHFHYDHFNRLSSVLDLYGERVRRLLLPADYTSADVAYAAANDVRRDLDSSALFHLARDEYQRVRALLVEETLASRCVVAGGRIDFLREEISWNSSNGEFSIVAHGPLPHDLTNMVGRAASRLAEAGATDRSNANEGSYVLEIQCGDFSGVFLGDSPAIRTERLLENGASGKKRPSVLKVAHHGAEDGTSRELLRRLQGSDSQLPAFALIAPFKKHGLPRQEVIDMLSTEGFVVKVSGSTSNSLEKRQSIAEEVEHVVALDIRELMQPQEGLIRLYFHIFANTGQNS